MTLTLDITGISAADRAAAASALAAGIGRWGHREAAAWTVINTMAGDLNAGPDLVSVDVSTLTAAEREQLANVLTDLCGLAHNPNERQGRQGGPPGSAVTRLLALIDAIRAA